MSKTLDIDQKIELWIPALNAVKNGESPICPRCESEDIDIQKDENEDGVGYLLMTCNNCNKSGYFSRIVFN